MAGFRHRARWLSMRWTNNLPSMSRLNLSYSWASTQRRQVVALSFLKNSLIQLKDF